LGNIDGGELKRERVYREWENLKDQGEEGGGVSGRGNAWGTHGEGKEKRKAGVEGKGKATRGGRKKGMGLGKLLADMD
jgi:hypothetical protein